MRINFEMCGPYPESPYWEKFCFWLSILNMNSVNSVLIFWIVVWLSFDAGFLIHKTYLFQSSFEARINRLEKYLPEKSHLLLYLSAQRRFRRDLKISSTKRLLVTLVVNIVISELLIVFKMNSNIANSFYLCWILALGLIWFYTILFTCCFMAVYRSKNQSVINFDFRSFNNNLEDLTSNQLDISPKLNKKLQSHLCFRKKKHKSINFKRKSQRNQFLLAMYRIFGDYIEIANCAEFEHYLDLEKIPIFTNNSQKLTFAEMFKLFDDHFNNDNCDFNVQIVSKRDVKLRLLPQKTLAAQSNLIKNKITAKPKGKPLFLFYVSVAMLSLIASAISFGVFTLLDYTISTKVDKTSILVFSALIACLIFACKIALTKLVMINVKGTVFRVVEIIGTTIFIGILIGFWMFWLNGIISAFAPVRLVSILMTNSVGLLATGIYSWIRKETFTHYSRKELILSNLIITLIFGLTVGLIMFFVWPLPHLYNLLNFAYPILGGGLLFLTNAYLIWSMKWFKQNPIVAHAYKSKRIEVPFVFWFVNSSFLLVWNTLMPSTDNCENPQQHEEDEVQKNEQVIPNEKPLTS